MPRLANRAFVQAANRQRSLAVRRVASRQDNRVENRIRNLVVNLLVSPVRILQDSRALDHQVNQVQNHQANQVVSLLGSHPDAPVVNRLTNPA